MSTTIKPTYGKCNEPECNYKGRLIADKCGNHYWAHRRKIKHEKEKERSIKPEKKEKEKRSSLNEWFNFQLTMSPAFCEECNKNLKADRSFMPKGIVAHILPKRENMFPELATHVLNVMFFCIDCHTDFDNKGSDHVKKMKSLKKIKSRVKKMSEKLTESQISRIPDHLK